MVIFVTEHVVVKKQLMKRAGVKEQPKMACKGKGKSRTFYQLQIGVHEPSSTASREKKKEPVVRAWIPGPLFLFLFRFSFFLAFLDCSCFSRAPFPFAASVYFSNFLVLRYSIGHTPYHRNQTVSTVRLWGFPNLHGRL